MAELVKQLSEEVTRLVRQELELARTEMTEKGRRAGLGLGELGAAGAVGLYALGALTLCFIAALALVMPLWGAALIVAAVYAVVAAVLGLTGRQQIERSLPAKPEQAIESVKEDIEWAKTQTRSDKR
ncbi:MAG TPA: phage holin family protein [Methylomirabilota bacterium]|nr:phage holin family protein [Methylomirabilota bacterium]